MRLKVKYTLYNLYKNYVKVVENPVSYKIYKDFYNDLGQEMYNSLVNGESIHLPCGFGQLSIYKKRPKVVEREDGKLMLYGYRPNWKATKELWAEKYPARTAEELKQIKNKPLIFHKNDETDGYRFSLEKVKCKFPARPLIEFNFVRTKNREFNKIIKNGGITRVEFIEK